jgi:cysteine desulfurase/selenocysteine lyase
MSTSELSLGPALAPGAGAAVPAGAGVSPGAASFLGAGLPGGSDVGAVLGSMVEQLANQYFAGVPGPALSRSHEAPGAPVAVTGAPAPGPVAPPSGVFPSATSLGALGVSPGAGWVPPAPGFVQSPPIASGPHPKESDLRTAPAMLSEGLGFASPVALARGHEPSPEAAPYFLELAGLPSGYATGGGVPIEAPGTSLPARLAPVAPEPAPGVAGATSVPLVAPTSIASAAGVAPAQASSAPSGPNVEAAAPSGFGYDARELSLGPLGLDAPSHARIDALRLDRGGRRQFDAASVRNDFPILKERVHGRELVWLDNAATTQKPRAVIDRISCFYEHENSNIHRAAHTLAARATDAYEGARETTRRFLNASSVNEIIFVRGTTEAINLVAQTWGRRNLVAGDEIVITWLEHHANIVPWQQIASERGARIKVAPVDDRGQVLVEEYEKLLGSRTKIVSLSHVSNALGTIVPVTEMVSMAHRHGAKVLVDGAQAVSHMPVDVQAIDADFYVFSGHKIFGPTGIGAVYGKGAVLEHMPPWQGGGNMIRDVTFERTQFQGPPARFEAGTPNIADAVGLSAALDYVTSLGMENISRYEHDLLEYATPRLLGVPGLRLYGTAPDKAGVLSFTLDGMKTEEIGVALDRQGIAVRAGHHCAQPILRRFGLESSVRASLAPYNTCGDVDALVAALHQLRARPY